ncbi:hypothetical protein ACSLBF_09270 [Pseudoalteromonas sp. T1lg65]|uniref:hypothetical protein n=1 Tax=Pseudoalteromonas sp. T1lg65 TaxID=2077101 RepID=UPI003F78F428
MTKSIVFYTAALLGVLSFANGLFMILAPESWYWLIPGVPDRGPFNQHFLRDIGIIYTLMGVTFIVGAIYKSLRFSLWLLPAAWLTGHAIFHIWEVLVGICGPESLLQDFAGVTLPAILALWLSYISYQGVRNE